MGGKLTRAEVVQGLLNLFPNPAYLEVGVSKGITFSQLKAARMTAVDPKFRFNKNELAAKMPNATFCEVSSDVFFQTCRQTFDVIYLDGLHTFEQTLRDFTNAIEFLSEGGVILVDDVIPSSYHAAMPDRKASIQLRAIRNDPVASWMGDVYRLVFFIETFFQQYTYATLAENHGQAIIWKKARERASIPLRSVGEIAGLPYERVHLDVGTYHIKEFGQIIAEILAARS